MGGMYGVASKTDCVADLFYGTDYHSHLGTVRGGMVVKNGRGFTRFIKDITNTQFRSKFEDDLGKMRGSIGIGVISDYEDQPLIIGSHLGTYALVTVGRIDNLEALSAEVFRSRNAHFSEMSGDVVNPTELVATLINHEGNFEDGIRHAQELIDGSCSMLLLTDKCIYAARDRLGRTPVVLGRKEGARAATLETCALPNLDYEIDRNLGPGEVVRITAEGAETLLPPGDRCRSAPSFGSTTAIRPPTTKGSTWRSSATVVERPWRGPTIAGSTWWPAFPTREPVMRSATPTRRESPTDVRSSSTLPPGREASCRRTSACETWWRG